MSAVMSRPEFASSSDSLTDRSVDELDKAIGQLVRQINAESYRMLVLVREFDDRFGWAKWSFGSSAEWLALRVLPRIAAAFAQERLSYSKVRALTRAARVGGALADGVA
jgi:hypothetical protein